MNEELKKIVEQMEALEARANELHEQAQGNPEEIEGVKAIITNEIQPELAKLTEAHQKELEKEELKSLKGTVTTLHEAIEELRKTPTGGFQVGTTEGKSVTGDEPEDAYVTGEKSFYFDIVRANKGRTDAIERLGAAEEGKAMTEGVGAQGGYLVQPSVERAIVTTREQDNVLRQLCSKLNVTTNSVEFNQITLGTTAGWVAELAAKPESTSLTLATVTASVFTAAGLATISNQLLADSNPAVDGLVTADLAKRLVALEETAFLTGSGTGQPLGILNTPGVQTVTVTPTDPTADDGLVDGILTAISQVQSEHGQPTAIVMHPRTWTRIIKDKNASGLYVIGNPSDATLNNYQAARGTPTGASPSAAGPSLSLWGVRVVLSNRIPTNLGVGTNESRVIVGDFSEALILDRQGITVDESPHVYFTSNQTVFRAEERVGFTAARQPKAFSVVGGAGLAAG